jgi:hypothetical protein
LDEKITFYFKTLKDYNNRRRGYKGGFGVQSLSLPPKTTIPQKYNTITGIPDEFIEHGTVENCNNIARSTLKV